MFDLFCVCVGFFAGVVVSALFPDKLAALVAFIKAHRD